jgi:hypothetical protein
VLFLINLRALRNELKNAFGLTDKELNIKRKKKMMLEKNSNGDIRAKRKNVIKIEIIE